MKLLDGREATLNGDWFRVDIRTPEKSDTGIILLDRNPSKKEYKPDCYPGVVVETSEQCKQVKVGDSVVFVRWEWSQQEMEEGFFVVREVDLLVVNDQCVNGYIAANLFNPFQKTNELIKVEKRRVQEKYFWGQIVSMDYTSENKDTKDLIPGDVIRINYLDDYQYHKGRMLIFKDIWGVVDFKYGHIALKQEKELERNRTANTAA